MLSIRFPQVAALSSGLSAFTARLRTALARAFPHRFAGPDDPVLQAFLDDTFALALAHGIDRDDSVAMLAQLRAAYGDAFELNPAAPQALALLHDAGVPGPIKIAAMAQCLHDETGGRPVVSVPDPKA